MGSHVTWKNTKLSADPSESSRGTSVLETKSVPVANQAPQCPEQASNIVTEGSTATRSTGKMAEREKPKDSRDIQRNELKDLRTFLHQCSNCHQLPPPQESRRSNFRPSLHFQTLPLYQLFPSGICKFSNPEPAPFPRAPFPRAP